MRIALFEDRIASENFAPIALLRPAFELLCGQFSARERCMRFLPVTDWGAFLRSELVDVYQEENPDSHVNDLDWLRLAPTLFINGRWLADPAALGECDPDTAGIIDGHVAYLTLEPSDVSRLTGDSVDVVLMEIARERRRVKAPGFLAQYPWDLVHHNSVQLKADFALRRFGTSKVGQLGPQVAIVGDPNQIYIAPSSSIDPFVVIDSRKGPVTIEDDCLIQAFTRLEGPCHVGRGSQLFRANVREGTSIGPICRVGGEIEGSILHGYVNKYHDGFLGHSYICPWVNLGAMTTNSDLKNDYSPVKIPLRGESINSGELKVGCFIGDHTKTAIGSLFNTGSSIGVMCLVLPDGELLPKHIPSFSRIWHGDLIDGLALDAGLSTARYAMERRNIELTDAQEQLLRTIHADSQLERERAIERFFARSNFANG
ncbi:putative sugar nucleotidyl transferase [Schlesneria paludicola]|uniref:putative sugar nucleotidyl transferase n=1 Tax=Schlesneria paludicola TaxID=360056 RepID=UPI00029AA1B5|nr:putative sugar nucleotidyl transferase [Schlesneria paludicola]